MTVIQLESEVLRPLVAAAVLEFAIESRFDEKALPIELRSLWEDEVKRFEKRYGYAIS